MSQTVKLFLSGVSAEFRPHREELALVLRRAGHEVNLQEEFDAGGGTLLEHLEGYIRDDCHGCIFLVGDRYGAEPPASEAAPYLEGRLAKHSYTQWEYLFALRHHKARFVFFPASPVPATGDPEPPELQALQKVFIQEQILERGKHRAVFHNLENLKDQVAALRLGALAYARHHGLPLVEANPYVGLRRFEEKDKDRFYGRSGLVGDLLRRVEAEPLLLVTGHSGSGKSSVLRAGVVDRWRQQHGASARVILFSPDNDPFEGLYEGLRGAEEAKEDAAWVKAGHADAFTEMRSRCPGERGKRTLVVVDQFEEIFTRVPEAGAAGVEQFVAALVAAQRRADPDLRIVLAMRDDFYGNLERHPALCGILDEAGRTIRVMRPTESELRAIIEAPAASHGVGFEGGLVERIVREVRGREGEDRRALLPLLQVTLEELWIHEVATGSLHDRVLNEESYEAIGGFAGALKQRIGKFYDGLDEAGRAAVQRVFLQLVQFGEADVPVSRSVPKEVLARGADPALLDRLITKEKLLISGGSERDGAGPSVELAHEALIDGWEQYREWIRENQDILRLHRRLEDDAAAWDGANEKRPEDLWRGMNLSRAEEARRAGEFERVGSLSDAATRFLEASRQAVEDEIARLQALVARAEAGETEARAASARAEANARRSRHRAAVATVFATVAAAGMLGTGWFFLKAERLAAEAGRQRDQAILQRDVAVQRGQAIRTNLEWMNFELRDMLTRYAPSATQIAANQRIDEMLRAVEPVGIAGGSGTAAPDLDLMRARATADRGRADAILKSADANPGEALPLYENALRLDEELARVDPENRNARRNVSIDYDRLGDLQMQLGDTAQAQGYYEKALAVAEELVKLDPANTEFRRDVSVSYNRLGDLQMQLGDTAKAQECFEKSLAIREELVKLDPAKTEFRRDVSISYDNLGDLQMQLGDTAKALEYHEKAFTVAEELVKLDPANTEFRRNVSVSYERLGDLEVRLGNTTKAVEWFERSLANWEALQTLDSQNVDYRRGITIPYHRLGDLQMKLGDTAKAQGYYEKSLAVAEELVKLDPTNTEFRRDVSVSNNRLGALQMQLGDTAKAQGYFEKSLAIKEELVKLDPANAEFRRDVAVSHAKLGQVYEASGAGGRDQALEHYRKVVEILEGMQAAGVLAPVDVEFIATFKAKVAELEGR